VTPARIKTRRARRALLLASVIFCVLFAASCRAILGTDTYESSADALCEVLTRCYKGVAIPGCATGIGEDLTAASAADREQWLRAFSDSSCLESCASARGCLNLKPVCDSVACGAREDCCDFLVGESDCDVFKQTCCAPKGVRCSSTKPCCPGAGDCDPTTGTCGGVECAKIGKECVDANDCCTKVCQDGLCGELCAPVGFECKDSATCCTGFCDLATTTCEAPPCIIEDGPCEAGGQPCCGQLKCLANEATQETTCALGCFSDGTECGEDKQCCGKRCNASSFCETACLPALAACKSSLDCCSGRCNFDGINSTCDPCKPNGKDCMDPSECCSQACDAGKCAPLCGSVGCAHDECVPGEPLSRTCTQCVGPAGCTIDKECVAAVCNADPYCCCKQWDPLCASEAQDLCGCD
jgi:hypothetical protein